MVGKMTCSQPSAGGRVEVGDAWEQKNALALLAGRKRSPRQGIWHVCQEKDVLAGMWAFSATRRWLITCRRRRRSSTSSLCCWTARTSSSHWCSTAVSGRTSSRRCSRRWRPGTSWSCTPTCRRTRRSTAGGRGLRPRRGWVGPTFATARPCSLRPRCRISHPPQTLEELGVSLHLMETLQLDMPNLETQIPPLHEQFTILEKYEVPVQDSVSS